MATQSYIIAREEVLIAAEKAARAGSPVYIEGAAAALREASEAFAIEVRQDGPGGYRANRDLWATLGLNANSLGRACPELRAECEALYAQLGHPGRAHNVRV
jgi:hypothetical protein